MGIGNYFMNTNVDLFHDSTNNSNGILTSESNEMDLNTLIPVVDNNNHKVVDARLLHAFLQIRRDFTSWIKDRISKYGFIENQDFVLIKYDYLGNLLNDRLPHFGESDTQVVAKTDYLFLYPTFFICSSVAFSFGNFPCHLPGTTTSRPSGEVASLPHSLHSPIPLYGCSSLA